MDSVNIIITSYAFILNFFPVFSSMEDKSPASGRRAVSVAMIFCFIVYVLFSFLAYFVYGDNLNPNIFENLTLENNFLSIFIRALFLIVFLCNITFIFLPGKEALLIMIDEFMKNSMSNKMNKRIE